jgi:hypothetical protein
MSLNRQTPSNKRGQFIASLIDLPAGKESLVERRTPPVLMLSVLAYPRSSTWPSFNTRIEHLIQSGIGGADAGQSDAALAVQRREPS